MKQEKRDYRPAWTLKEAADVLHCTERFLRDQNTEGRIKFIKPSPVMVRISAEEFDRYIRANTI